MANFRSPFTENIKLKHEKYYPEFPWKYAFIKDEKWDKWFDHHVLLQNGDEPLEINEIEEYNHKINEEYKETNEFITYLFLKELTTRWINNESYILPSAMYSGSGCISLSNIAKHNFYEIKEEIISENSKWKQTKETSVPTLKAFFAKAALKNGAKLSDIL